MGALQLDLLYILYFAAAEPNAFLLFYDYSLQDKQERSVIWRAFLLIAVLQAGIRDKSIKRDTKGHSRQPSLNASFQLCVKEQ